MRELLHHLRAFLRDDGDPRSYAVILTSLIVLLTLVVGLDIQGEVLDEYHLDPRQIPLYMAFYGLPWLLAVICHATFTRRLAALRDPHLWLAALAALALYSIYANFHYYADWIATHVDPRARAFVFRCAANLARAGLGFVLVLAFWCIADRRRQPLYGLQRGAFRARPYLLILLGLVPLVTWASFQPDFLEFYPRHTPGREQAFLSPAASTAIFELCYGADFVFTELFFRGLLVLGFTRWLGPGAVLPATVWYALTHVAKPVGELVGSVFGGFALAAIACRTRSIRGGILLHLGLAYMMELAAILQKAALTAAS